MTENNEMIIVDRQPFPQGDVLFVPIDSIPESAKRVEAKGGLIVRHSDAGHHHVIESPGVAMFGDSDPLIRYLHVETHADVVHHRTVDPHKTVRLMSGAWAAHGQGEPTPEGWASVID